jgi:hypothetical protein
MPRPGLSLTLAVLSHAVAALMGMEATSANRKLSRARATLERLDVYNEYCGQALVECSDTYKQLDRRCGLRGTPVLAAREE